MQRQIRYFFLLKTFLFVFCCAQFAVAQTGTSTRKKGGTSTETENPQATPSPFKNDTLFTNPPPRVNITADDTTRRTKTSGDIDTVITYSAKDTVLFTLKNKKMRLRGNAKVDFRGQKLEGEVIEIEFDNSLITASAVRDSAGNLVGSVPTFTDNGEPYVGEKLSYNFKTRRGAVDLGETKMGEGFYFGSKIKRVDESTLFIKDGFYTTCDAPHPHYYFGSPQMKIIVKDRVFVDPLILYVEDLPVFGVPFGLFFPNKGGRQSGLIVPNFFFDRNRGVVLQNLGYYLALSDYYDTKFVFEALTSKGGFVLNNTTNYAWITNPRQYLNGAVSASYGYTRFNTDDDYNENWKLGINHNQSIDPFKRFTANVSFLSTDYNQNVSTDIYQRLQQEVYSDASYTQDFENSNISLGFNRTQNLFNGNITQTSPRFTYTVNTFQPFSALDVSETIKDITFSSGFSGFYRLNRTQILKTDPVTEIQDTSISRDHQSLVSWSPNVNISPKFGYFTIQPFINFNSNLYFRRIAQRNYSSQTEFTDVMEAGFFPEYSYSTGVNFQTKLIGMIRPNILSITGLRHIVTPSIGWSFTPDQSDNNSFFGQTTNSQGTAVNYSRFEKDGNSTASTRLQQNLNFSFVNAFQAKIAQPDTLPDLNLDLLNATLRGSYNFAADSLKFSNISVNLSTPYNSFLNVTASGEFDLYDKGIVRDSLGNEVGVTRINQLLYNNNKGFAKLTNVNVGLTASFSSEGLQLPTNGVNTADTTQKPSAFELGSRFRRRENQIGMETDEYGDDSPGYSLINIPWRLDLAGNYTMRRNFQTDTAEIDFTLVPGFSFDLTPSWKFSGSFFYNFKDRKIDAPRLSIIKDLHCWDLRFEWYPNIGGYNLRFGIKASELKDLFIESRSNPIFQ